MDLTDGLSANTTQPEPRQIVRNEIERKVGDTPSLVGTLADAMGIVLVHALADVVAIAESPGNEGQRRRLEIMQQIAGGADIAALATAALGRIASGEIALTASVKGLEGVIDDTLTRSTQTAQVLIAALGALPTGTEETNNA